MPETQPEATDEQRARAVKFVAPDVIEGPVFLYGYRDTDLEKFEASTDYCLDWFGKSGRPTLYEHGLDAAHKTVKVGQQVDTEHRDAGIWQQTQLEAHARYRKEIDGLIERGVLGYSAGAMQHLAKKSHDGTITVFPWVETSLTPTPASPGNIGVHYVKSATALAHLADADRPVPAQLIASAIKALDDIPSDDDSLPDGLKFADLVDRLSVDGPAWVKARRDWYAKSGRVLSAATRERLLAHPQTLRQLADDLDDLLSSVDGDKSAKPDLLALLVETGALDERLIGLSL